MQAHNHPAQGDRNAHGDFSLNNRPVPRECPKCHAPYLLEKETKREGQIEYCNNPECGYRAPITPTVPAQAV